MREIIDLVEAKVRMDTLNFQGWEEEMRETASRRLIKFVSKLPKTILKKDTHLFHGTDSMAEFEIPRDPAFFSERLDGAENWIGWAGNRAGHHHSVNRVMEFVVVSDIEIIDLRYRGHDNFEKMCKLTFDSSYYPPTMANELKGIANGWIMPRETMIVSPETVLMPFSG